MKKNILGFAYCFKKCPWFYEANLDSWRNKPTAIFMESMAFLLWLNRWKISLRSTYFSKYQILKVI